MCAGQHRLSVLMMCRCGKPYRLGMRALPVHHPRRISGLYLAGEAFLVGGSKVLRSSEHDDVTLIGVGVTLHECLRAAEILRAEGWAAANDVTRRPGTDRPERLMPGRARGSCHKELERGMAGSGLGLAEVADALLSGT
jgi:hypothetical protein